MERLIWITWRAFWIGLGASLVLIVQALAPSVLPHAHPPPSALADPAPAPAPRAEPRARSAEPILSRNPFDSKTGPLVAPPPRRPRGA